MAINNIFDNALKYTGIAKKPIITVVVSKEHKYASVSIEDNGPGIPKEYQTTIFDRFVRVDESRDRQTGGFGLGLAISKKIITESGGSISLKSRPGNTIFIITLPISKT
jgi:two-component system OmpR family sensor kinase